MKILNLLKFKISNDDGRVAQDDHIGIQKLTLWGGLQQLKQMYSGFYIPNQLEATEKLMTIGMDLELEANGETFGMVKQKLFAMGSHFNLEDLNGNIMCFAQTKFDAITTEYQIFDSQGIKIGQVTQQLYKNLLGGILYVIQDAYGNVVGQTKEWDQVKTHVEVVNSMNYPEVKMERTHIFKDKWTIAFAGNSIDRRLLIFFPAFISSKKEQQKQPHY